MKLIRESDSGPAGIGSGSSGAEMFEAIIAATERISPPDREPGPPAPNGPLRGRIIAHAENGPPVVEYRHAGIDRMRTAQSLVRVEEGMVGQDVALLFEGGDMERPIIIGVFQAAPGSGSEAGLESPIRKRMQLSLDGRILRLEAAQELTLVCGQSSIQLGRDGKIVIRGEEILSRATGTNKIKGGAVHLN